jgi:hypothetical protein
MIKIKDVFIGCGTRTLKTGAEPFYFGFCQATDAEDDSACCFTEDGDLLSSMDIMSDSSFITFSWDPGTGECIRVGFSNQSFYLSRSGK